MKTQYEMLEAKLNAAHAVITEVQSLLRLMRDNGLVRFKDETYCEHIAQSSPITRKPDERRQHAQNTPSQSTTKDTNTSQVNDIQTVTESDCVNHGGEQKFLQGDLFDNDMDVNQHQDGEVVAKKDSSFVPTARPSAKSVRHRGDPAVDRKSALANFREIVKGREIIHLADVNRIFGYNESTSGHFVRDAVKDGRLATIDYGKSGKKFLAKSVREFIKAYFDAVEGKCESAK